MKINKNKKTAKFAMSLKELPIVSSRISNRFHCLANLKILKSLKPRSTVKREPFIPDD